MVAFERRSMKTVVLMAAPCTWEERELLFEMVMMFLTILARD